MRECSTFNSLSTQKTPSLLSSLHHRDSLFIIFTAALIRQADISSWICFYQHEQIWLYLFLAF